MPVLNTATNIKVGVNQAKRVYQGTTQVWPPLPANLNFLASWTSATENTLTWGTTNTFNPKSLPGLSVWYDAANLTTPITTSWPDKSGTNHPGTIYSTPAPVLVPNGQNGLNVVRFKFGEGRVRTTGTGVTTSFTMACVGRMIGPNAARIITTNGATNNFLIGWWGGYQDVAYDNTQAWLTPTLNTPWTNAWKLYSSDGIPGSMQLFSDGTQIASGAVAGLTGWGGNFYINGHDAATTAEMSDCEIAEVLLYNGKLTAPQRQQVEGYLRTKWMTAPSSPIVYDLYYSKDMLTDWTQGTTLATGLTSGMGSFTHFKDAPAQQASMLYYGLVARYPNGSTAATWASAPKLRGGTDWLPITIGRQSDKIQALYQIPSGVSRNASITASGGNYTVNWGDGSADTNHSAGTAATHTYTYSSMSATGEIAAGRQAMATISAQSGQTVTGFKVNDGFTISPNPDHLSRVHTVAKPDPELNWQYEFNIDSATWPLTETPWGTPTVFLTITNPGATTMSVRFTENGGESTQFKYMISQPASDGSTWGNPSTSNADPDQPWALNTNINAGQTLWVCFAFLQNGTGIRKMRPVIQCYSDLSTAGVVPAAYPKEVTVASDTLRDVDVRTGVKYFNTLSTLTATTFKAMFETSSLVGINGDLKCLSTTAKRMFAFCIKMVHPPTLTTTGVTDFTYMFRFCQEDGFRTVPLFDTSSGTDFSWMFYAAFDGISYTLNSIPFFDTSNGTSFRGMFSNSELTTIPKLDTSKGTDFYMMFSDCEMVDIPLIDTSNGTNFSDMLSWPWNPRNPPAFDTSKGTDFSAMYQGHTGSSFNLMSVENGTNFSNMLSSCDSMTDATLPSALYYGTGTSKGTDFSYMFYNSNGAGFTGAFTPFNTSAGTTFESMFQGVSTLTTYPAFNTANGTTFQAMFYGCTSLTAFPTSYNFNKALDLSYMFSGCTALASNGAAFPIATPVVTNLSFMFRSCTSTGFTAGPVFTNTATVTDFSYMFNGCTSLNTFPTYNMNEALSFDHMFYNCSALTSNGTKSFTTPKATNFAFMFYGCSNAGFTISPTFSQTATGTDFNTMYRGCTSMTTLPPIDLSNADNVYQMFYGCTALTSNGSRTYTTPKVTNFSWMFYNCANAGFTTSPVFTSTTTGTSFQRMFYGCNKLTAWPSLDTSNSTDFSYMFNGCTALTTAAIPTYNTAKGTNFTSMFSGCNNVGFTTIPALNCSAGTNFTNMFSTNTYVTLVNITGVRRSISISTCAASMPTANINTFYTNLGTADNSGGQQTVTVTNLTNHAASNKTIATGKGWTVSPP